MSTASKFLRNIFSNVSGYVVNILVALFLSPYLVHGLGDEAYGLWTLVISLTGYYGLLDLGVRSAVGQYVTRYWAQGDMAKVNRTVNTAVVLLSAVACIALIATAVLVLYLPDWIEVDDPAEVVAAQWAMAIAGLGISIGIPLAVYSTATYAQERFEIQNAVGIGERLLFAAAVITALEMGHGLLGVAVAATGVQILSKLVTLRIAYVLMPGLKFSPRGAARESLREIYGYGVFAFIINASERFILYTDVLIVGAFLNATAVTYYAIGGNLVYYYNSLILAVTWTITPHATACDARGERESLRKLLMAGTRGLTFIGVVVATGMFLIGKDFLSVWMGPKYVSGAEYTSSYLILVVLTAATLVRSIMGCNLQILFGMRRVKFLAAVAGAEAILNLVCSLVFVRWFGMIGVALGTLVPVTLAQFLVQGPYCVRLLKAKGIPFVVATLRAGVPVAAVMWGAHELASTFITGDGWLPLIAKGLLITLPAPFVGFFLVLSGAERREALERIGLKRAARVLPQSGPDAPTPPRDSEATAPTEAR